MELKIKAGILTVSDKASRGEREDRSGPALRERLEAAGADVVRTAIVPDEQDEIRAVLMAWSDEGLDLVLTTGGTGLSPRDWTPEATRTVLDRETPGISEAIRAGGLGKTRTAMLSRAVSGIRRSTLIINLPGSEKSVREGLAAVIDVLPHAVEVLRGAAGDCAKK
jgi:molybdenum cofactor synthesis domain-containing protein